MEMWVKMGTVCLFYEEWEHVASNKYVVIKENRWMVGSCWKPTFWTGYKRGTIGSFLPTDVALQGKQC